MKLNRDSLEDMVSRIRPWYFLGLAIVAVVICIYGLRSNNEHMNKLRSEVYAADQNDGDVQGALQNLEKYVASHMNTNLSSGPNAVYPPIQLKYTYERLVEQQSQAIASSNSSLYTEAEDYCQTQVPSGFSGRYRIPCVDQYIQSHSLSAINIPTSLYEFDFISPRWSPDLAGWSLVAAIVFIILFVSSWLIRRQLFKTVSKEKA